MLMVYLLASNPSATIQLASFWTPHSLSKTESNTPVHSLQLVRPWTLDGFAIRTTYRPIVGIALQKIDPRHGWQTLQLIHRINQRVIHHSMDQQAMLLRIDIRNALHVVHQEMEAGRCDDPIQILKRSR